STPSGSAPGVGAVTCPPQQDVDALDQPGDDQASFLAADAPLADMARYLPADLQSAMHTIRAAFARAAAAYPSDPDDLTPEHLEQITQVLEASDTTSALADVSDWLATSCPASFGPEPS